MPIEFDQFVSLRSLVESDMFCVVCLSSNNYVTRPGMVWSSFASSSSASNLVLVVRSRFSRFVGYHTIRFFLAQAICRRLSRHSGARCLGWNRDYFIEASAAYHIPPASQSSLSLRRIYTTASSSSFSPSPNTLNCAKITKSSTIVPKLPINHGRFVHTYSFSRLWNRIPAP